MNAITVTLIDANGVEHIIKDAEIGRSLMDVARNNAVEGVFGDCGGGCACATCHVYIAPEWRTLIGDFTSTEGALLDFESSAKPESRLSCQIILSEAMNGLRVTVASE